MRRGWVRPHASGRRETPKHHVAQGCLVPCGKVFGGAVQTPARLVSYRNLLSEIIALRTALRRRGTTPARLVCYRNLLSEK